MQDALLVRGREVISYHRGTESENGDDSEVEGELDYEGQDKEDEGLKTRVAIGIG